jgi:hypothetical protein
VVGRGSTIRQHARDLVPAVPCLPSLVEARNSTCSTPNARVGVQNPPPWSLVASGCDGRSDPCATHLVLNSTGPVLIRKLPLEYSMGRASWWFPLYFSTWRISIPSGTVKSMRAMATQ